MIDSINTWLTAPIATIWLLVLAGTSFWLLFKIGKAGAYEVERLEQRIEELERGR